MDGIEPRGVRIARTWIDQIRQARHGVPPGPEEAQRILDDCFRDRPCNGCGATIGQPHDHGCHVEQCQYTGAQWIACGGMSDWSPCDCEDDNGYDPDGYTVHTCRQKLHDCGSEVWDGVWPGYQECVEFGWYSRFVPVPARALGPIARPAGKAWMRCGPEDPGAGPDLSRLHSGQCRWDREAGRWMQVGRPDTT